MDKEAFSISSLIPSASQTLISAFVTFLFGLIGVLVGASWQQHYAIQLEQQKDLLELRRKAYSNFFDGQTDLKLLNSGNLPADEVNKLQKEYSTRVMNARFHIAVYGSRSTVEALSDFFEKYSSPPNCSDAVRFSEDTKIYFRMREEHLGGSDGENVALEKMALLIHNCRLSTSQARTPAR